IAPAALTLGPHATVNHVSSRVLGFDSPGGEAGLVNLGTMNFAVNGGRFTFLHADFTNHGLIAVSNGDTLLFSDLPAPTSFTNAADGTVTVASGGTLSLSTAGWTNVGTIAVNGGNLNLGNTFTQARLGTVDRVGGTINIVGTLDNTGTTFNVGAGSA